MILGSRPYVLPKVVLGTTFWIASQYVRSSFDHSGLWYCDIEERESSKAAQTLLIGDEDKINLLGLTVSPFSIYQFWVILKVPCMMSLIFWYKEPQVDSIALGKQILLIDSA